MPLRFLSLACTLGLMLLAGRALLRIVGTSFVPTRLEPGCYRNLGRRIAMKVLAATTILLGALMMSSAASADIDTGLVAYYCFDDASNLGKDCSPNGNNGTAQGQVTAAAGLIGGAASFGGYNNPAAIRVPNSASLQFTNDATISFAVNLTGFDGMDSWGRYSSHYSSLGFHSVIAKSHDTSGSGFAILIAGNEESLYSGTASYEWAENNVGAATGPYQTGQWRHFTYVFSNINHTAKLYADGVLVKSIDNFNQSFASANAQDLYLGKFSDRWYPLNGRLDEVRIYSRALSDSEILQLYHPSQSAGLSCTTNTISLPVDETACFYDGSADLRNAILKKDGVVVATASLAGNEGGFCADNLLWLDAAGKPISDWSGLFGAANTILVQLFVERTNGVTSLLGGRAAHRSQFDVAVTPDQNQTFPMSGPHAQATFTATPKGGTAPYTYAWTEVLDYSLGYGNHPWAQSADATMELPGYGEKYQDPALKERGPAINDLHPINLRVTDSTGKLATVQCLAAVTNPYRNGNPSLSGSGSQLQRGVDLASGNYHLSATDLSVSGKGPDFVLTRAYNSNVADNGAWTFNLDLSLYFSPHSMGREISVGPREDGREQRYYRELDGTWHALNPGNFDQLTQTSDGRFVLYTQGNLLYRFAAPEGTGAGRLEAIADRDNNVLQFTHTANRITGATTAGGDKYSILRAGGQIKRVTDFTGRYVEYTRNADGMITAVRNPLGKLTKYAYTTGSAPADRYKLVSITDPRDKVQATIAYNSA